MFILEGEEKPFVFLGNGLTRTLLVFQTQGGGGLLGQQQP